ncbi:hypothetical protein OH76DRAFT_1358111 [Lentinus brumalis]|uniref:Uncharacterized protein n=1 Tax=Lentinus brumalis TaxID=2498619 RepID=A0A371CYB1_9APHY|nr:hypothetical protein OH76DRAFT_1358111 [Polyporus brumalis]
MVIIPGNPAFIVWGRYYSHVQAILAALLHDILGVWFRDVTGFLAVLRRCRALVCGHAALAYVLRDSAVLTKTLEVSVPADKEDALREHLVRECGFVYFAVSARGEGGFLDAVISHHYWISGNHFLTLHCSPDRSAITPIAREPNTALMNFVSPVGFGSAYAALTLQRMGLSVSWRVLGDDDRRRNLLTVAKANVRLAQDPCDLFSPLVLNALPGPAPLHRRCFEGLFACPRQGRYFGDGGSLVDFFDITTVDLATLRREHLPPFGTTTVWRLPVTRPACYGNCARGDDLLPGGIMTAPAIIPAVPFHYGPRFAGIRAMY